MYIWRILTQELSRYLSPADGGLYIPYLRRGAIDDVLWASFDNACVASSITPSGRFCPICSHNTYLFTRRRALPDQPLEHAVI